jgi:hypothetical protein
MNIQATGTEAPKISLIQFRNVLEAKLKSYVADQLIAREEQKESSGVEPVAYLTTRSFHEWLLDFTGDRV